MPVQMMIFSLRTNQEHIMIFPTDQPTTRGKMQFFGVKVRISVD